MFHIPNDKRAQKSADLIAQGLYKCLEKKPLSNIKVNDIYLNSYVSRATFYRLFDSVYDVLLYECDLIANEVLQTIKTIKFVNKKEEGIYCMKLWLKNNNLIKAMADNNLYSLLQDTLVNHKEGIKLLYGIDYDNNPQAEYLVFFLVSIIFTSFVIYYKEKGKRSIEEVLETTNKLIDSIVNTWGVW